MKQSLLKFTILSLVLLSQITSKAQTWAWKNQLASGSSSSSEVYQDVAVDGWGNTYAIGYFDGTIALNGTSFTAKGSNDVFVTKTNKSGNLVWIKAFGGNYDDKGNSITLDNHGNPYITGYYTGAIKFDSKALDSLNTTINQVFIAKLDTSGNTKWAINMVSARSNSGEGIEYSTKSGKLFVCGKMGGTMYTKGLNNKEITLTSSNGTDNIFIGKLDTTGGWVTASRIVGNLSLAIGAFSIDKFDNYFISFSTYYSANTPINVYKPDSTTLVANISTPVAFNQKNNSVVFITKIASDYTSASKYLYQNYDVQALRALAIGNDNQPVIAFRYRGFNGTSSYQLRKLSNDLTTNNTVFARNIGSTYFLVGGIAIDKDLTTNILFATNAGTLDNTGSGASTITLTANLNFYIAKINSSGQWFSQTVATTGTNNAPDGTFLNGGLAVDTATNELYGAVNLAYVNFKAGYFNLNSKTPLNVSKFDGFIFKHGCVNAGFYAQPKDSLACPNGTIYAAVEAYGSNFIYSWKKNNVAVGTNSAIYSKSAAAFADSGLYKVVIKSVCFKDTTYATSNIVKLGVKSAPVIIEQPKGDTVCVGKFIKIGVKTQGYGLKYNWMYTGCVNCVMGTSDTMTATISSKYMASNYYVTITDACNRNVTSTYAPIVTESAITGYTIAAGASTCVDGTFKLIASATSTGNSDPSFAYIPKLKYTWLKDNVAIPNSNSNFLTKTNVALGDSGNYTVEISNSGCKIPVTPTPVKVSVVNGTAFNSGTNLKFYLPFNGTYKDESGLSNFTTTSTATFDNDRNSTPNAAVNLTPAQLSNQIRIPDSTFVKSTVGTLSFWFKTSTINQVLFGTQNKALGASPNLTVINAYIDYSGFFRGALYTGSTFTTSALKNNASKNAVNDNKWHNVVISYNNNTQSIYIDGILQYTISAQILTKATISFVDYPLSVAQFGATIGSGTTAYYQLNTSTTPYFTGQMDDISVHSNAFDACDVARLYSLGVKVNVLDLEVDDNNSNIALYPNPFDNVLSIESNQYFGTVVISDINGKKIISAEKDAALLNINTAHLPLGVYIVKVGNLTKKIIK